MSVVSEAMSGESTTCTLSPSKVKVALPCPSYSPSSSSTPSRTVPSPNRVRPSQTPGFRNSLDSAPTLTVPAFLSIQQTESRQDCFYSLFHKKLLKIFEIQPPHRMCGYCRLYCDVLADISLTKLKLKTERPVPFSYCCSSRFCQGKCLP